MTGAQPKLAESRELRWHCDALAADIVCPRDVLERIRSEVVQAFCLMAHSGIETGGILFGRRTDALIEILDVKQIACEHRLGPSFLLSEKDEAELHRVLASAASEIKLQRLRPVGLYVSHARRGFSVAETDLRILDRYFPDSELAMILLPTKVGPTRAGFFVRSSKAGAEFSCAHELLLRPPDTRPGVRRPLSSTIIERPKPQVGAEPAAAIAPVRPALPLAAKTVVSPAIPEPRKILESPPIPATPPISASPKISKIRGVLVMASRAKESLAHHTKDLVARKDLLASKTKDLLARINAYWVDLKPRILSRFRSLLRDHNTGWMNLTALRAAEPFKPMTKWLRATQSDLVAAVVLLLLCATALTFYGRRVAVSPARVPIRVIPSGSQLRIEWDPTPEVMSTATEGTLEIRDGGNTPVRLRIFSDSLRTGSVIYERRSDKVEVHLKLVRRNGPPSESIVYFVNPASAKPQSSPVVETSVQPVSVQRASNPAADAKPSPFEPIPKPAPPQRIDPPTIATASRSNTAEPRVFRPPAPQRPSLIREATISPLPDMPTVQIVQPASAVLSASSLAAPSSAASFPYGPRSGRMIWTGELRKGATIQLSMTGASRGVLNGHLPGYPVQINVHPAEVTDDGLAILTLDRSKDGVLANASNGWKRITYKWAAKGMPELDVVEPPGPGNGWKQIVLRNGNRNLAVLIVEWQLTAKQ